jgi:hypothetical protein
MVQKVLETTVTVTLSKQSGFGVAVENPCSKSGPTVGSFFQVYAEFVKELHFNLVCHCAWMVEWQKSTGIATSFEWQPIGRPRSEGKCICEKAHKYMIHGPAERRPHVSGVAYHAAVCALPRGVLEEIYCAFEAREAAAIQRWDEASVVEKIRAVSMQIDGCPQSMLDCPVPNELVRVHESAVAEDLPSVPILETTSVDTDPAVPSRFTAMEPRKGVKVREKQLSLKSMELGLSADEIQRDTVAETARMLAMLPGTAGHSFVVKTPLRGSSPDEMLDEDEELEEHASLVTGVKLLMSVQQVTAADIAAKVDCPETDITAWLKGGLSPRVEKQYDQVMWELQCEQPPWWASRLSGRCLWAPVSALAAAPAEAPADLMDLDCPDGEVNGCAAYGVVGMSDENHGQLSVSVNIVADHPLCVNGHPMITCNYAGPGYVYGYVCDKCTGCSEEGHLEWTRERWHCGECEHDVCFQCSRRGLLMKRMRT